MKDVSDARSVESMLAGVVDQLAILRQHVAQLGADGASTQPGEPGGESALRNRLLREIDAVHCLAQGARDRLTSRSASALPGE